MDIDLSIDLAGIKSPNPFWLASAPPTNMGSMVQRAFDADSGADGIELNFGCPHGMSERGMGSAMGQVPEYCEMVVHWVKEVAKVPVLVKLTPNVADINKPARAAKLGGADGLSLINTINSV